MNLGKAETQQTSMLHFTVVADRPILKAYMGIPTIDLVTFLTTVFGNTQRM